MRTHRHQRGFTLLEVIAVVVVVSVILSMAVLVTPGQVTERRLDGAEQALQAFLVQTAQTALYGGTPVGVVFHRDGYRRVRLVEDAWQDDGAGGTLPPGLQITLNGVPVAGAYVAGDPPQLVYTPIGEVEAGIMPFEIGLLPATAGPAAKLRYGLIVPFVGLPERLAAVSGEDAGV